MHPWELDTEQRYYTVTLRERITHYHGRRGLTEKLERLFEDFAFGSLREILEHSAGECEPKKARPDLSGVKAYPPAQQRSSELRTGGPS